MTLLVTGGAGFIGANFVLDWLAQPDAEPVVNVDKLTYAGNLETLASLQGDARHHFVRGDIADQGLIAQLLAEHQPRAVINFAAESHVDRSILGPDAFVQTNVVGSFRLLEAVRQYWGALQGNQREDFRFLHVSTDEVYGSLGPGDAAFTEDHRYEPNSPYSASKAASDHLVRAYHHTYGLPVLTTNCSNNYGPFHFPEKLIPLMIVNALAGKPLPVYGDGLQVRAMTDAMRSTPAACIRNWAGSRPRPSTAASAKPCAGTWTIRVGWSGCKAAPTVNGCRPNTGRPREDLAVGQGRAGGLGTAAQPSAPRLGAGAGL